MAKRLISILAVICVFTMSAVPANTEASAGNAIMPMYTDTSKISCDLCINGDTATVVASVRGKASTVKSCSLKVELQEKVGILWITKNSWNIDGTGNELGISESANVSSGKNYRVTYNHIHMMQYRLSLELKRMQVTLKPVMRLILKSSPVRMSLMERKVIVPRYTQNRQ